VQRRTEAPKQADNWDEKLFLAVVAFLLLKGLLKASDAANRRRVQETYEKLRQGRLVPGLRSFRSDFD
jgi:hypothetical protein